ncbi:LCP family protein [uncultured Oscillibacter sp.]|uniref:LCP family protein n=1 Tax=uncultured Oscillibacter sp. TaxID=876091 RepID=UPI0025F259A2|nr:LCP family protein [uncultured Oscillibacter sp.]
MEREQRHAGGNRLEKKPPKPKKPSRFTKQQKIMIAVAAVLAVAVGGVLAWRSVFARPDLDNRRGGAIFTKKDDGTEEIEEIDYGEGIRPRAGGERKSEDFYTVLILGLDTGGGGHTDTMLLASYDVTNQKATVMSIPRDTMVNVPWDVKKINSVYLHYGGGERGIQALYKEVSQLVGFEPDYQVVVEWEAVGKLVDAIGGVDFNNPYPMDYHDPYQDLVIEQAPGLRHLNGNDAMQIIRWRKNDKDSPYGYHTGIGDDGRIKLQQDFLKAVIKQMMTIKNVGNINKIAKVFDECVETDLAFQEIFWFAQKAILGGLNVDNVEFLSMPFRYANAWSPTVGNMQSYVAPIAGQLLDIVNNKLSPYVEVFTRRDLDIMSVNADGSLSSSTGYVEDKVAALPPDIPSGEPENDWALDANGNPYDPETGFLIDPETGEIMEGILAVPPVVTDPDNPGVVDPGNPGVIDPNSPGVTDPGTTVPNNPGTVDPGTADPGTSNPGMVDPGTLDPNSPGITDPGTTVPPDAGVTDPGASGEPVPPPEPADPGFVIIDPVPVE